MTISSTELVSLLADLDEVGRLYAIGKPKEAVELLGATREMVAKLIDARIRQLRKVA